MSRRMRYIPPGGSMVEVTTRTLQGRFLLRPAPRLRRLFVGVLARAAERSSVRVHAAVFLSNHYHLLLSVPNAKELADFMEYTNSRVAQEARRFYGWDTKVWSRRYDSVLVTDEESAQVGRLEYLLAHGAKEGLVASPLNWPGVHSAKALMSGKPLEGIWVDRERRRRKRQANPRDLEQTCWLPLEPLPCWESLSPGECRLRISDLVTKIESEAKASLHRRRMRPLGAAAVLRQDPRARPRDPSTGPAPFVHGASKALRQSLYQAFSAFVEAYRAAAAKQRAGESGVAFPEGSFPPPMPFVARGSPLPRV